MKADEEEGRGSPTPMLECPYPMGVLGNTIARHGGVVRPSGAVFIKKEITCYRLLE
jgi:hypothetical protein